jgi:hypothetical protein
VHGDDVGDDHGTRRDVVSHILVVLFTTW